MKFLAFLLIIFFFSANTLSESSCDTNSPDAPAHADPYIEYLGANGVEFISVGIDFSDIHNRRVIANIDITPGTTVIRIPRSIMILTDDLWPGVWDKDLARAPREGWNNPVPNSNHKLMLAIYAADKGFLKSPKVAHASAWLKGNQNAFSSSSYPYFNKNERAFFDSIFHLRALHNPPNNAATKGYWRFMTLARTLFEKGPSHPDSKLKELYALASARFFDIDVNYGANTVLNSAIKPGIDLLNHALEPNVELKCSDAGCEMRAITFIKKGDEIMNSYGKKSSFELLEKYGFVLENNPYGPELIVSSKCSVRFKLGDTVDSPPMLPNSYECLVEHFGSAEDARDWTRTKCREMASYLNSVDSKLVHHLEKVSMLLLSES